VRPGLSGKKNEVALQRAEMRMVRWMYNVKVKDRVPSKELRKRLKIDDILECGPMPNLMVALPNIGGALCSTPQSLADAHY